MRLKTVKTLISYLPHLSMFLALLAGVCYFMKKPVPAVIFTVVTILFVIIYFALALVSWRCPHCHQYLPTKNAKQITECPHCHKPIF